ncbi:Uncharacterised protein [Klebsiella pneumoniae]|nr:Uncharacterised protein [Klebsiella pneumoniae]
MRGDTQFFRYTNADQDINAAGAVWQQQAISDGGLSVGAGDSMDITLPTTNPVAMLFRGLPPSQPVRVRIHRWHVGDSQGEFRTVWIGSITEVKREAIDRTRLVTASLASTFTRSGLRLTWGAPVRIRCMTTIARCRRQRSASAAWLSAHSMG